MTNRDSKDDNSCSNAQNSKSILVVSTTVYVKADAGQRVYQNSEFSWNSSEFSQSFLELETLHRLQTS